MSGYRSRKMLKLMKENIPQKTNDTNKTDTDCDAQQKPIEDLDEQKDEEKVYTNLQNVATDVSEVGDIAESSNNCLILQTAVHSNLDDILVDSSQKLVRTKTIFLQMNIMMIPIVTLFFDFALDHSHKST